MPYPGLLQPEPLSLHSPLMTRNPQEMLKHSSISVSVASLGPSAHDVCLSPLITSGGNGVWFLMQIHPSYRLAGTSPLTLVYGVSPPHHSSSYCLTGVSLTLDMWFSSWLLLTLDVGYLPFTTCSSAAQLVKAYYLFLYLWAFFIFLVYLTNYDFTLISK